MGNQLAAAATVNVADVSPTLELIAPLGGEGRSFFTTLHCWRAVGEGGAELYARGGGAVAEPQRRVQRHRQWVRDKLSGGTSPTSAPRPKEVQEAFHFSGALRTRYDYYMQILLRRSAYALALPDGAATAASNSPAPRGDAGRAALGRMNVVVKVFVRSLGDEPQRRFLHRMLGLMRGVAGQLAAVDATLPSRGAARGSLFYNDMDIQDTRFALLQRAHVAFSLPERLATRPYYGLQDRLFVCYQLLRALAQLHDVYGVVHGDLKASNVLLQSSGWLYLVDLAPFKPARLPVDNPAVFDYYYDTDDTRHCCLAPEKFTEEACRVPRDGAAVELDDDDDDAAASAVNLAGHTAAMDVFSAGCVMAHVLTDEPLLRLSEVLELRGLAVDAARTRVESVLHQRGGVPASVVRMLCDALHTDPTSRPSARELLTRYTPAVFSTSLGVLYDDVLPTLLESAADVRVQLLYARLPDLLVRGPARATRRWREHAMGVLLPILLQAVRFARTDESTYRGVVCLGRCVPWCAMTTLTDVVLPHVLYLVNDITRYQSITTVVALRLACRIARRATRGAADANERPLDDAALLARLSLFDDLVLPCVGELLRCAPVLEVNVLVELARQLPRLLCLAQACLERRQLLGCGGGTEAYGAQLHTLRGNGWDMLQVLYSHRSPHVVEAVLRETPWVGHFLGVERTENDLVPLLTTAIASSVVVQRRLFASALAVHVPLLSHRRTSAATLLKTVRLFLDEGLGLGDVTGVVRTLRAFAALVRQADCEAGVLMPLVHHALPLLLSPQRAIRFAAGGVVEAAARRYRASEVVAYLYFAVRPLLTRDVCLARLCGSIPAALRAELVVRPSSREYAVATAAALPPPLCVSPERVQSSRDVTPWVASGTPLCYAASHRDARRRDVVAAQTRPTTPRVVATATSDAPHGATVIALDALDPIATPLCTLAAHGGPIYDCCAPAASRVLTVGAHAEARLWDVDLTRGGLQPCARLAACDASPAYTLARLLPSRPAVLLGSSAGTVTVVDLDTMCVVHTWHSTDAAAVTAGVFVTSDVLLLGTAAGALWAVDVRVGGSVVWSEKTHEVDVAGALVALGDASHAYGAVVGTRTGAVLLYDLRLPCRVARWALPHATRVECGGVAAAAMRDVATTPSVLLGASDGTVYRVDVATEMMSVALQTASCEGAAVRAMLTHPTAPVVFTAGEDRHLRRWSLREPAASRTLYSAPASSPSYEAVRAVGYRRGRAVVDASALPHTIREVVTLSTRPAVADLLGARAPGATSLPPPHHTDTILALTAVHVGRLRQPHLVSASRDGVVTVWQQRAPRDES